MYLVARPYSQLTRKYVPFEDFLEDIRWLDLSCFLHFVVQFLRSIFVPGLLIDLKVLTMHIQHRYTAGEARYKVLRNEYRISPINAPELAIAKANWKENVDTGSQLIMSARHAAPLLDFSATESLFY